MYDCNVVRRLIEFEQVINALNSGADCFMADFEDSLTPRWYDSTTIFTTCAYRALFSRVSDVLWVFAKHRFINKRNDHCETNSVNQG